MPRVWADKDFDTRVRRHLYVIYLCSWELYVISSRISFLISKFLCDWYNLAINKVTLHVNESCLICLIHKRTHLLWVFYYRGPSILFSIYQRTELQTRIKSTVTYFSTMRQTFNTYQDVLYFFHSCFRITKSFFQNFFNSLYERGRLHKFPDRIFFCCLQSLVV